MRKACTILFFGLLVSPATAAFVPTEQTDEGGFWSQVKLVEAGIRQRDTAAAEAALEKLTADFAAHSDLPYAVYIIGKAYEKTYKTEQAGVCYRYVMEQWPQSPYVPWARLAILDSKEAEESDPEVQAALAKLVALLGQQSLRPKEIHRIAEGFRDRHPQRALALFQYNSSQWPADDESVLQSHMEVVRSHVINGDDAAADGAFQTVLKRYAAREDLSEVIYRVGNFYTENGRYDKAEQIFRIIDQRWPNGQETLFAQVGRARLQLDLGNVDETEALFQRMLTDYATAPRLVEAVRLVGVGYWRQAMLLSSNEPGTPRTGRGGGSDNGQPDMRRAEMVWSYFGKAAAAYERIINDFPEDATHTPFAYYYGGEAWSILGDRQKAIAYLEKLCETWPDHERVWTARFTLGRYYERQAEAGVISSSEAESKTKTQYERLLEDFPTAASAAGARSWLDSLAIRKARAAEGAKAAEARAAMMKALKDAGKR
jgi:tetratricopeptide (TPR) repeat protein